MAVSKEHCSAWVVVDFGNCAPWKARDITVAHTLRPLSGQTAGQFQHGSETVWTRSPYEESRIACADARPRDMQAEVYVSDYVSDPGSG